MEYQSFRTVYISSNSVTVLEELSKIFFFEFRKISEFTTNYGMQYSYNISDTLYGRLIDVNDYIINGEQGNKSSRAKVLYSLYACGYLTIVDIKYPTYKDWKEVQEVGSTLDHKLPKYWFPEWTFDCNNWQPLTYEENKNKGDDFIETGKEKLEELSLEIQQIKSKYL